MAESKKTEKDFAFPSPTSYRACWEMKGERTKVRSLGGTVLKFETKLKLNYDLNLELGQ